MKQSIFSIVGALIAMVSLGCSKAPQQPSAESAECRGTYYKRSSISNELMKYNETFNSSLGQCLAQSVEITNFEKTLDERQRKNVKCSPQSGLPSMTLKASGNFYSARDDHHYIDLNAETGEYRMLSIGTFYDGRTVIERRLGCYYLRTDTETEPINSRNYGSMIMFGQENAAMSDPTGYDEIYNYTDTGVGFEIVDPSPSYRMDWTYEFCPFLSLPLGFCDLLRNGNILYLPSLDLAQQAAFAE
ncbi:MAG: hypothetical protein IPK68_04075 [Bdellovibrionales bacterium]|nr:hypothetical protein [Bdellovibrionales bacterium]